MTLDNVHSQSVSVSHLQNGSLLQELEIMQAKYLALYLTYNMGLINDK